MSRLRYEMRRRFGLAHAAASRTGYPDLVAVVLIDTVPDGSGAGHAVSCFAALQVSMVEGGPVFAMHHAATTRVEGRTEIMSRLASLCSGRDVVLGSADPHVSFADRRHLYGSGIRFLDAVSDHAGQPPSDLILFGRPERSMAMQAAEFELTCCHRTEPLDQARCAPDRAQLVWAAYVKERLGPRRADGLLAAYRAWSVIRKCRPVPF